MDSNLLERINILAAKSRSQGLTDEEKAEQANLRKQYIAEWRQGTIEVLDSIRIIDTEGNKSKLIKKDSEK